MTPLHDFDEHEVVVRKEQWSGPDFRCKALGHYRYQCGKCKLGYFRAKNALDHDDACPECKYRIFVSRVIR